MAETPTEACCLHYNLYSFDNEAIERIIGEFSAAVRNVEAQCYYDREDDGFLLKCPQHVGAEADQALSNAINGYLSYEHEHGVTVHRFPASLVQDDDANLSDDAPSVDEADDSRLTDLDELCVDLVDFRPVTFHAVSREASASTIKLFNLRDVTEQTLERTLVHPGNEARAVIYRDFTCRVAQWSAKQACYVFNGRVGSRIGADETDARDVLLEDCCFLEMQGESQPTDQELQADTSTPFEFEFKGAAPTVRQFLAGMGEIVPTDPNTGPDLSELPKDALKFKEAPDHQVQTIGRNRRPEMADPDSDSDSIEDDSSDDDDPPPARKLARLSIGRQTTSIPTPAEARPPVNKDTGILAKLKAGAQQYSGPPEASLSTQLPVASAKSLSSQHDGAVTPRPFSINLSAPGRQSAVAQGTGLPEYTRKYAKVDKVGLTTHAATQAEWLHEEAAPAPQKRDKWGIASRSTLDEGLSRADRTKLPDSSDSGSAAMSFSTGPESMQAPGPLSASTSLSLDAPSSAFPAPSQEETELQPWAYRTHRAMDESHDLVNVSTPRADRAPSLRPPPGLGNVSVSSSSTVRQLPLRPPPGLETASVSSSSTVRPSSQRNKQQEQFHQSPAPIAPLVDQLIDTCEEFQTVHSLPMENLTMSMRPLQPIANESVGEYLSGNSIQERLQDTTNDRLRKKFTMRQKATKKSKGTKAKQVKTKVELPLPDPIRPRFKGKAKEPSSSVDEPPTGTMSAPEHESERPQSEDEDESPAAETNETLARRNSIARLLHAVEPVRGLPNVELTVMFGLILIRSRDDSSLSTRKYGSEGLQSRFQVQQDSGSLTTNFFSRMTTSCADALHVLRIMPGADLQSVVEYHICLRDLQGVVRTVRFDQKEPDNFLVLDLEKTLGTLYLHYPIRVWDAMIKVSKLEIDETAISKLRTMVSSVQTVGQSPSFMAHVPTGSFTISQIQVKRFFTKEVVPNVYMRWTEVQDLKFEAVTNSGHFNLRATALERDRMIDEQRLWFECSLHLSPEVSADGLQDFVDHIVSQMDGVGFDNKGPYVRKEIEEKPEEVVSFW